jgi:hypothetical protein
MKIQSISQTQTNFTARSVQIRDAQWVSHVINSEFPHFSTTKFIPIFSTYMQKFSDLLELNKPPKTLGEIQDTLHYLPLLVNKYINSAHCESQRKAFPVEDFKRLFAIKNITSKVYNARLACKNYVNITELNETYGCLYQLKDLKLGNCSENALMAELILKLNGIKNSYNTKLLAYNKENPCARFKVDHIVCAFNDDGSPVGNISKKTIIIDPWIGKADYAEKMKLFYQNEGLKNLNLSIENPTITFTTPIARVKISEDERKEILELYPELQFKAQNRDFMQNKTP